MNLELTAASFLEQFPTNDLANDRKKERYLQLFGQIAFGGFGIAVLAGAIGLIYTIITRMVLTQSNFWAGLVLATFVVFAGLSLAYVILNETLKQKPKPAKGLPGGYRDLPGQPTAPLLEEGGFEPAVTITEDTTDLLTPQIDSRRRRI